MNNYYYTGVAHSNYFDRLRDTCTTTCYLSSSVVATAMFSAVHRVVLPVSVYFGLVDG